MTSSLSATTVLFHCIPTGIGLFIHSKHDCSNELYAQLPHLYAVAVADNSGQHRRVSAIFFAKSAFAVADHGFIEAMITAASSVPAIRDRMNATTSLLPAPIDIDPGLRLPQEEMQRIASELYLKLDISGSA